MMSVLLDRLINYIEISPFVKSFFRISCLFLFPHRAALFSSVTEPHFFGKFRGVVFCFVQSIFQVNNKYQNKIVVALQRFARFFSGEHFLFTCYCSLSII